MRAIPYLLFALLLVCCKKEDTRLRSVEYKVVGTGYSTFVTTATGSEIAIGTVDDVARYSMQVREGTPVKVRATGLTNTADFTAFIIVDGAQLDRADGNGTQTVVAEGTVE